MSTQERFQLVIPAWLKEEVKKIAITRNISMSEAIKDILKQYVTKYEHI